MKPSSKFACLSLFWLLSTPAFADFNQQFPGKGSIDDWNRSGPFMKQGLDACKKKNYREAERLFRKAEQIYPYDPVNAYNLGKVLNIEQRCVEAESWLRKSISMQQSFDNWDELGVALAEQGKLKEAYSALERAQAFVKTEKERTGLIRQKTQLSNALRRQSDGATK